MTPNPRGPANHRWRTARYSVIAILFFALAESTRWLLFQLPSFRAFYRAHPWQVGETVWKVLWIVIALAGIWAAHRASLRGAFRELGLSRSPALALLAAWSASLPLLLAFAFTLRVNPAAALLPMWMTVVVSPVAEEVLFRGYLFRQLHVHGRWPFWLAVLMNAAPFIWGHLHQAAQSSQAALGVLWVVLIMGIGAAAFSWVFIHWDYNLWFPIGLHSAMNLWWYLFNADESAYGGWSGNVARAMTLGLAIAITLRRDALTEWLRNRLGRGSRLTQGWSGRGRRK